MKNRNVRTFAHFDAKRIAGTLGLIVFDQPGPQLPGLCSNNWIQAGIEGGFSTERFGRNDVLLQKMGVSPQYLFDCVREELSLSFCSPKRSARNYPLQLTTYRFRGERSV